MPRFFASLAAIAGIGLAGLCLLGLGMIGLALLDWASPFGSGLLVLRDRKPSASALSGSIPDAKKTPAPKSRGGDGAIGEAGVGNAQFGDALNANSRPLGGSK